MLARFLSADPNVDGVSDAQGFNRYSYVGNNPLGATDPTGYFGLKSLFKIVAVVAVAYFTAGAAVWAVGVLGGQSLTLSMAFQALVGANGFGLTLGGAIAAGAGGGFASGFAASLLNGGSIGDAFKAGAIGGLVGGVTAGLLHGIGAAKLPWFERGLAHGVVQGGATEAIGGEFRHGFYAGFAVGATEVGIGEWAGRSAAKGFAAATVVGGTASALGGGKFANGAASGAFSYLFNQLSTRRGTADEERVLVTESKPELVDKRWIGVETYSLPIPLPEPGGVDAVLAANHEMAVAEYVWSVSASYRVYDTVQERRGWWIFSWSARVRGELLRTETLREFRYSYRQFSLSVIPFPEIFTPQPLIGRPSAAQMRLRGVPVPDWDVPGRYFKTDIRKERRK